MVEPDNSGHPDRASPVRTPRCSGRRRRCSRWTRLDVRGRRLRVWKNAPPTLRAILEPSRGTGRRPSSSTRTRRLTFDEHFRAAAHLAHDPRRALRRGEGRPRRHRHAQLPGVVDRVLGGGGGRRAWSCRSTRGGRPPSSSTACRTRAPKVAVRRRRARSSASPTTLAALELAGVIVARSDGGRRSRRRARSRTSSATVPADATLPDGRARPRGRRHDLLHVGHDGPPKGALGTHRNICGEPHDARVRHGAARLRASAPAGDAAGDAGPERVPAVRAVLPRHGLPLGPRRQPRLRREARDHAQVGPRAGARADRARAGHHLRRRAVDGVAGARVAAASSKRDISSVQSIGYGGAPAPPELVRRIEAACSPGARPRNGYGLTETSSVTTINAGVDYQRKPDSVGVPVPVVRRQGRRRRGQRRAGRRASASSGSRAPTWSRATGASRRRPPRAFVERLVPHRRRRAPRRRGLRLHRRPRQGHGHPRRRERLLRRGRGRAVRAPRGHRRRR